MKLLGVVVIALLVIVSLFALLNWSAIVTPSPLSVGFTTVNAPLGLVLLVIAGLLTAVFAAFVVFEQTVALVEARRAARDLHAQRELADKAEASRFTDLRAYLEEELRKLNERSAAEHAEAKARIDRLEQALVARLTEAENGLAAHVGEVEDKIDRALGSQQAP